MSHELKYLTNELFQSIIEKHIIQSNEKVSKIIKVSIMNPMGAGENFCSEVLRALIGYELSGNKNGSISFIVKILKPTAFVSKNMIDSIQAFPKERMMYENIVPEFERILRDAGEEVVFGPK